MSNADDEKRLYDTMHAQQQAGIDHPSDMVNSLPLPEAAPDVLDVIVSLTRGKANLSDQQIFAIGKQAGYTTEQWIERLEAFVKLWGDQKRKEGDGY